MALCLDGMKIKYNVQFSIILTFVPRTFIICIMYQQMHNWWTIYYTALWYTVPTCFDIIASSSGSS